MSKRYWLYKYYVGDRLVYVGQTKQPPIRRYQAHCAEDSKYEDVDFVEIAEVSNSAELNIAETAMISELKPPWNKRWADMDICFGVSTDILCFERIPISELNMVGRENQTNHESPDTVRVHNNMNRFSFSSFTALESNIVSAICLKLYKANGEDMAIHLSDLKSLSGNQRTWNDFIEATNKVAAKVMIMEIYNKDTGVVERRTIFDEFYIDENTDELIVKVNSEQRYLFCELVRCFTIYNHRDYCKLPTSYAKSLYRLCCQWRSVGAFTLSMEQFAFAFGVPRKFQVSKIDERIIKPSITALQNIVPGLRYEKIYGKPNGRGRTRVTGYRFFFDKREKQKSQYEEHIEKAKELGITEETAHALWLMGAVGEDKLMEICADIQSGVPF